MGLAGALAALLLGDSNYGYQLIALLEAELGPIWTTRPSQVYLTLGRMQRDGWLEAERVSQSRRPDRHLLTLTRSGRRAGQAWLDKSDDDDLVVRLAVARIIAPESFAELIEAAINHRAARLRSLRKSRNSPATGFRREALEAEIQRVYGELRWLDSVAKRAPELVSLPRADKSPTRVARIVEQ